MEYKYTDHDNYEDFSSGRVLHGVAGVPNFPVRLGNEIYRRCRSYCPKKDKLMIYDPCCGGGYLLSVLGFLNPEIETLVGSDIDYKMLEVAEKNLSLLSKDGLLKRESELRNLYELYQKTSHKEALESLERFKDRNQICKKRIFKADCTQSTLRELSEFGKEETPDIIITDVPYGNLVKWSGKEQQNHIADKMVLSLESISGPGTILAVISDKNQKICCQRWTRLEKQQIGKRRFEILQLNRD